MQRNLSSAIITPTVAYALISAACVAEETTLQLIQKAEKKAVAHSLNMAKALENEKRLMPHSLHANGKLHKTSLQGWTSGFFPGTLWYCYECTGDEDIKKWARQFTNRMYPIRHFTGHHDIGFMMGSSYGQAMRLAPEAQDEEILLTAARSAMKRYAPRVGLIKSWDNTNSGKWKYPVIIDNMMNLELLLWAAQLSDDESMRQAAISHADKTLEHHYRPDGSCYHVVSYDPETQLPHHKQNWQGAGDESVWSRGQTWGLYGFTVMYRFTKESKYLVQAQKIANFLIHHPNMPADGIPLWDLKADGKHPELRDASSAAIMASALLELSLYTTDKTLAKSYVDMAEKQIRRLCSPEYLADVNTNGNYILKHSVGSIPHNAEIDAPISYADYYFMEALSRYKLLMSENVKDLQFSTFSKGMLAKASASNFLERDSLHKKNW